MCVPIIFSDEIWIRGCAQCIKHYVRQIWVWITDKLCSCLEISAISVKRNSKVGNSHFIRNRLPIKPFYNQCIFWIRKSKKMEVWRKIRQRRPKMAGNTQTFVLVMWYNIDVIRWMPQRFLCAVNCIRDIFPNEPGILRPSAECLGDQNCYQIPSRWISLIRTLKTEHSGLQVRWPMEGANMRRRDDGESRSDPRSAWTCQAKQARDDLHG